MEWGQARVQIAALRDEIFERLDAGQTVKRIYEDLKGAGRIQTSRAPFYRHVTRLRSEAIRDRDPARPQSSNTTRRVRAAEPQVPRKTQPSVPAVAESDGPRLVDAGVKRLPVAHAPSSSSPAPDIDRGIWEGNLPETPEGSS